MREIMNNLEQIISKLTLIQRLSSKILNMSVINRKRHRPTYLQVAPPIKPVKGKFTVTMLPGVATGPQMMEYIQEVYKAVNAPIIFERIDDMKATDKILASIRKNRVAIKGHIPEIPETASNITLRSNLNMYVYKVHIVSYPNVRSRIQNMDIIVFRQNIEGEYSLLEHTPKPGIVEGLKIISRKTTRKFAQWAYGVARREKRKKVSIVHKANIMKLTDGLFMETIEEIGRDYPEIKTEKVIIDDCSHKAVRVPHSFDVIITPNLYGNILISIFCGLIGGHGLISGQNFSDECGIFEVGLRHLAFEDEMYVNPVAIINAGANLLLFLKQDYLAKIIFKAVYLTLVEDKCHTPDLGGKATSSEVVERVICRLKELAARSQCAG
ncbi:unnamed protein product [Phyllotreta striolata]|uniref:Isopropylmalate dehydrogenase-like domain-containing protein n=1 Tax=Phyllotreta striolata TaxID=444603 RepID=A0A9N9XNH7_PHYSR|nr:unnamed protein product [Phyllotreta striolata]